MYILKMLANNGETVLLEFETRREAEAMRQAFMNTGDYRRADVHAKGTDHANR